MTEYIERRYIRKMAMLEMAYTMETETDAAVVLRMIDDAPAADVTPVVRCKDCKHLVAVNVNGKGIPTCRMIGMEVAPAEFCSRGEKMDGGADREGD